MASSARSRAAFVLGALSAIVAGGVLLADATPAAHADPAPPAAVDGIVVIVNSDGPFKALSTDASRVTGGDVLVQVTLPDNTPLKVLLPLMFSVPLRFAPAVDPVTSSSPGPVMFPPGARLNCSPRDRVALAKTLMTPVFAPPPDKFNVPDCTSSVPLLLNGT